MNTTRLTTLNEAVDDFIADYLDVVAHVIGTTRDYPAGPTLVALMASTERREWPPLPVLMKAVGWVLFMSQYHERTRRLTTNESDVRAAARRVYDSLHGPRHH